MSISGVCPDCGYKFPLHQGLEEAENSRALAAALSFPDSLAVAVIPYINLFSPKNRSIAKRKLNRLLRELTGLIQSGQVSRRGMTYGAPQELWKSGLEDTLAAHDLGSLVLPLKDHNFLCEVVWRKASKAAGKAERDREEQVKQRQRTPEKADPKARAMADAKAELVHFRGLLEQLSEDDPNRADLQVVIDQLEQKLGIKEQ